MEVSYEFVRRLMLATTRIDEAYYMFSKRLGVKENTLVVLYAIDDGRPHSQKEISEKWLIPKTTVNTNVHELVRDGYVELIPGDNPKEKIVCLTEKGREYTSDILESVYMAEEAAMDSAAKKYSSQFVEAMEFFASKLCEEFEKSKIK